MGSTGWDKTPRGKIEERAGSRKEVHEQDEDLDIKVVMESQKCSRPRRSVHIAQVFAVRERTLC